MESGITNFEKKIEVEMNERKRQNNTWIIWMEGRMNGGREGGREGWMEGWMDDGKGRKMHLPPQEAQFETYKPDDTVITRADSCFAKHGINSLVKT